MAPQNGQYVASHIFTYQQKLITTNKELYMSMNEDTLKGKWLEIKGEVQKAWGQLTMDELDKTKGDMKAIAGLVQQKHGDNKEQFHKKFSEIIGRFEDKKDAALSDVKKSLKN
jgi:uncharacterized protein YjbJ (UPF0337 family)